MVYGLHRRPAHAAGPIGISGAVHLVSSHGRLRPANLSAVVAAQMRDDFDQFDRDGKLIRVVGLSAANVLTSGGWHDVFLGEHVNFGRNTQHRRNVKKDCVDATVGAYELLTEEPKLEWAPTDMQGDTHHQIAESISDSFVQFESGIA